MLVWEGDPSSPNETILIILHVLVTCCWSFVVGL
ncbi:hypothetical protein SAMN05216285_3836 [Natrinema salifodinae]|uniref:Uncharacterized protein n=1 Tax=Natrinema salifodinae TaxID=1202768 RepID=A0A1I0QSF2_9EURY|nr:hypothetical protein SAMN05216285_3836 [Natrinema salifodinae]